MTLVLSDSIDFTIERDDFEAGVEQLRDLVKPGMPVLVHTRSANSVISRKPQSTFRFFYAEGIDDEGFSVEQRRIGRGLITDHYGGEFEHYIASTEQSKGRIKVFPSWFSFGTDVRHHEFSRAGPSVTMTTQSGGMVSILLGNTALLQAPSAARAARFVSDAYHFMLHHAYVRSGYLARQQDVDNDFEVKSASAMSVHAVRTLIEKVADRRAKSLKIDQIGCFKNIDNIQQFYPVNGDDFVISDSTTWRPVAFVNTNHGLKLGHTYVLPARGFAKTVEKALRHKRVDALYPACAEERQMFR